MRYGVVILPEHPWPEAREVWARAERLGFDHAWTYDHLSWRWLRDQPWFGLVPTLTAAALVTSRLRIGPLVVNPGLHHPAGLAKDLATIDHLSGGRLTCAVGAGGYDADALSPHDLTPGERRRRHCEFVVLLDALLRGRPVSHEGRHYTCRQVTLVPMCVQQPRLPLAVAATGPQGLRLAARLADVWVTTGPPNCFDPEPYARRLPSLRAQVEALEEACAAVDRDPATIGRLVLTGTAIGGVLESIGAFEDCAGQLAAAGVTDLVVHWPRPAFPFEARMEVLEEVAARCLDNKLRALPSDNLSRYH